MLRVSDVSIVALCHLSLPQAFFKGAWSNVLRGAGGALVLVFYDEIKVALGGKRGGGSE